MRFTCLVCLLLLTACGSIEKKTNRESQERLNIEHYYPASGITQYFLADLPDWANFSYQARCHRGISVRYLNFEKMGASYSLSYGDLVQFQQMLNLRYLEIRNSAKVKTIFTREEEIAFYDVYDRIKGGMRSFLVPEYSAVNFAWIDGVQSKEKLLSLFKSDFMTKGHPVLISLCMSLEQMEKYLLELGVNDSNIRLISAEMFTPFNTDLKITARFGLDFTKVFRADQELHFFTEQEIIPEVFQGNFIYHKF